MKFFISILLVFVGASAAQAEFKSSSEDLLKILSDATVQTELADAGDLWTVHRIQSGQNFGYQIVTAKGCRLSALLIKNEVFAYPKECHSRNWGD